MEWMDEELWDAGSGQGIFFIWGGTGRTVTQRLQQLVGVQSSVTISSMMRRKLQPRHHWMVVFFKRIELTSKEPESVVPSTSGMSETAPCLHLILQLSALLQAVLFLPVPSIPAPVGQLLYSCTCQGDCRVKSIINPLQYRCVTWVPRLTSLDLRAMLLKWNLFVCRELTVLPCVQTYLGKCISKESWN